MLAVYMFAKDKQTQWAVSRLKGSQRSWTLLFLKGFESQPGKELHCIPSVPLKGFR